MSKSRGTKLHMMARMNATRNGGYRPSYIFYPPRDKQGDAYFVMRGISRLRRQLSLSLVIYLVNPRLEILDAVRIIPCLEYLKKIDSKNLESSPMTI